MTEYLGSEHHTFTISKEDLAHALYAATEARDLPGMADVDSSLLLFCEEIKRHVTVALSGECADEIFGRIPVVPRQKYTRSIRLSMGAVYRDARRIPGRLHLRGACLI